MKNIEDILVEVGYSDVPDISAIKATMGQSFPSWIEHINFREALDFYGLTSHGKFMSLFLPYLDFYNKSPNLQRVAYVLNQYLFDFSKYNWECKFNRNVEDMFAAVVLLSGYKKHIVNMQRLNFDAIQIEKHKHRIYECCTIGFDTYGLSYMQDSQLKWGTLFINTHIYEIGRLQFEVNRYEYKIENFDMKDEFCVDVHIPRGGHLDNSLVEESLLSAQKTLPRIYKELPVKPKFFLFSWLLSKEVNNLLPENSNIKLFSKRFKIIKTCSGSSLNHFLFNQYDWDIKNFPEETSLQKVIKQKLLSGEKFYDAIGELKQL
ncbi:MAG: hypothetical protein IJ545_07955 [Alphaproteobacteria bacterium]|nr:hypothetical protein [Alphaproteobacteria bacterium]